MNKEEVLIWLTQLGTGWVGLATMYIVFVDTTNVEQMMEFWGKLEEWHNMAHITKRHADAEWDRHYALSKQESIEQYKLTRKALELLEAV